MPTQAPRSRAGLVLATCECVLALAASVALALVLESCGGECGSGASGPSCPPPTTTTVVAACTPEAVLTNAGAVPASTLAFFDFPVTGSGRLDLTLDWTNASSPMGLYLVPAGTCSLDEFNLRSCNFLVRSEPGGPKPRRVSAQNLAAGNYRYLVGNFASADESAALQIVLSKGNCPAIANGSPSATADARLGLNVARALAW